VIRLAQVFSNLLNNAAKYTERGGRITLTVKRQGDGAEVSVRDTGIGIPPHMLPKLFEIFTQVDRSLGRSQGGLGIGLSLVKGLVEMHDGTIEARSEGPGRGSEFIARLPVVDGPLQARQEPIGDGKKPHSGKQFRILIADDNRDAADSLAIMLRLMRHETQKTHDGEDAVQAVTAFQPDIALLDIGMPKLSGYDVARHIRGQSWGKKMVLVALTGWGQEQDKRRATEAGFDHHMTKPVSMDALQKLLASLNVTESKSAT
jgi:CheY-like chemotaxis protein